ncbi:MAG: class I SAM-dependent methyltransferase [Methanospirillum sp.]|nr:class I SAM-dependent methyltransferase [Methanospirillum sp.]
MDDPFEAHAAEYDRWFEEHPAEFRAELARVRRMLPAPGPRTVEVGAGSGRFAAALGVPLGIEPSRALGRMARERGVEVVRGRAEALPLRDGTCPGVLMVTVICFLGDPAPALREARRVLEPGGILVLAFIERGGAIERMYAAREGKRRFLSRARFYSADEVSALLRTAGLVPLEVDARGGFCVIAAGRA